ncbi:MAG: hydroxymethylpyrimidine/phosphomethylpyrimidine kinase [Cryptosporangiaceae bacterium]|nr:hydroxymethylpyrimidine/phosphomethylpyrimidine kinase [Cryptosporangiaceae bacterium]
MTTELSGGGSGTSGPAAPPVAMTVAGTDSGGSAGLACDLKTFHNCGVHGVFAVTAVTVQNSLGVSGVHPIPPETVAAQIDAVASDIGVGAAKTGMLASAEIIRAVAAAFQRNGIGRGLASPLVIDPVAASMHGDPLLREDALDAIRDLLFPVATLVTPNLDEVRLLTGITVSDRRSAERAARALYEFGPESVLVKGGHLANDPRSTDLLFDGETFTELPAERIDTPHTHGGGDSLGAATTAALAKGEALVDAVRAGKRYVTCAVATAYPLGAGVGPVGHFWRLSDGG